MKILLISAVMASLRSVSMLTLQTPYLAAVADHVFRDALCAGDVSAVFVAERYEFGQHGGCAVENQRGVRDQAC